MDGLICPNGDDPAPKGSTGHLMLGPPDFNSIMSYCAGAPTQLSPGDVEYIKKLFGEGDVVHGKNYALRLPPGRCWKRDVW